MLLCNSITTSLVSKALFLLELLQLFLSSPCSLQATHVIAAFINYLFSSFSHFKRVVKGAFNQRRKTLRNSLSSAGFPKDIIPEEFAGKRAEQLSVQEFHILAGKLDLPL